MTAQDNSGVPSWVRVGAKVVCHNAARLTDMPLGFRWIGGLDGLQAGQVYTIRGFAENALGVPSVHLAEIIRTDDGGPYWLYGEPGYRLTRFRPLVTRTQEQDVSQFTHLLSGVRTPEPVQ